MLNLAAVKTTFVYDDSAVVRKTALHEDVDPHFLRLIFIVFFVLLRREFCGLVHFVCSTNVWNDKIYNT